MKKQFIDLQKSYKKLYGKGLVGVSSDYIHTNLDFFKAHFTQYERRFSGTNLELWSICNGVKFITLISPDVEEEKEFYYKEMEIMRNIPTPKP